MENLTCPKCQSVMRSYERNGVSVDQCTECRGIFLDRGELERLVDAEAAWNQRGGGSERPRRDEPRYEQPRYEQPRYEQHGYQQQHHRKPHKRKKSFFEEMFD
jgi:Zn-finger nucleic acid-binding protein